MTKNTHLNVTESWLNPENLSSSSQPDDPLGIDEVDHVEFLVGNARQACHYYCSAFGFSPIAYRGPETGYRDAASYVINQNKVYFVLTTPLRPNHPYAARISTHGDSVKSIALRVTSCEHFYYQTMKNGAVSAEIPTLLSDENGEVKRAAIQTYGDTEHTIIERTGYSGAFLPGFVEYDEIFPSFPKIGDEVGLLRVDHIVGNVELGSMNRWVDYYERVLEFQQMTHFSDEDISTEYSALMSKVMRNGNNKIKFPINEPAQGKRKSQIEEYLDFHCGPGVQHVALLTGDIIHTVRALRSRGVQFLEVPRTYYDDLDKRIGKIAESFDAIAELGILADRDDDGYLLQLFTKPVQDRPTVFFEVIQRKGSQGFGVGNFKALFEAIEREQAKRGNL
ncbi:MAG: 4-hydroxyphenylpyruvate dioxygenase [Bdellovibrionales bacterium]|nr:4-hydroxyphenylpyruvate dioxygenase [Bdellovibrionales bacterium]